MKLEIELPALTSIGYHRISDNGVTSFRVPNSGVETVLEGLRQDWDIDIIWTRNVHNEVDYYCDKKLHNDEKCPINNCLNHA